MNTAIIAAAALAASTWHHDDSPAAQAEAAKRIADACSSLRESVAVHHVEYFYGKGRLVTGEYFDCNAEITPDDAHTRTDQQPETTAQDHK